VVQVLPSDGFLNVSMQSVRLKKDSLLTKSLPQVMFGICQDFDWFRPYELLTFTESDSSNPLPIYTYYPSSVGDVTQIVDAKRHVLYQLDMRWCEAVRNFK